MIELMSDPQIWMSLATLTFLEIVLGIDNVIFVALMADRLAQDKRALARRLGLGLALIFRVLMLGSLVWLAHLDSDLFTLFGHGFSWRDLILLGGGLFLLAKATMEIDHTLEGDQDAEATAKKAVGFGAVVVQIAVIDIVFSLDSVITAVGMSDQIGVMITAVVIAMGVMVMAADTVAGFIRKHPTTKMLALSFLLLVGLALVADGLGFHIPRGYLYFAIAFSLLVEVLNILARRSARV
ncbi:TerC family protein [Woodsholea maritima]|uniref:TerC family protein n=1 Tax=Woodsholea maritima TaxID=240237 RepID=UPI00039D20D9|nr:TerC family protein [Woodsholea maritima]